MVREIWRRIPGWPHYRASNHGRIRSEVRTRRHNRHKHAVMTWGGKILRPGTKRDGHRVVVMPGQVSVNVATLVALAFKRNPRKPGEVVRHLNDVPTDDRPSNLAYGTHKQNQKDAARNGRIPRGEQRSNAKLKLRQIPSIRRSSESLSVLARRYGVSPGTIKDAKEKRTWA